MLSLSSQDLQKKNVAFARWRRTQPDWLLYSRNTAIQVQHQHSQEHNISWSKYQQWTRLCHDDDEAETDAKFAESRLKTQWLCPIFGPLVQFFWHTTLLVCQSFMPLIRSVKNDNWRVIKKWRIFNSFYHFVYTDMGMTWLNCVLARMAFVVEQCRKTLFALLRGWKTRKWQTCLKRRLGADLQHSTCRKKT